MKYIIFSEDIDSVTEACPYCMTERYGKLSCCGEVHFEKAFVMIDNELLLDSEVILIDSNEE